MTYSLTDEDLADIAFAAFGINGVVRVGTDHCFMVGPRSSSGRSTVNDSMSGMPIAFLSGFSKETQVDMAGVTGSGLEIASLDAADIPGTTGHWIGCAAEYCARKSAVGPVTEGYTMLVDAAFADNRVFDPTGLSILIIPTSRVLAGHAIFYDAYLEKHVLFSHWTGAATAMCVLDNALGTYLNGVAAGDFFAKSSWFPAGKYMSVDDAIAFKAASFSGLFAGVQSQSHPPSPTARQALQNGYFGVNKQPSSGQAVWAASLLTDGVHFKPGDFGNLPKEPKEPHCPNCGPSKIMFAKGDLWKCWWCEGTVKR